MQKLILAALGAGALAFTVPGEKMDSESGVHTGMILQ